MDTSLFHGLMGDILLTSELRDSPNGRKDVDDWLAESVETAIMSPNLTGWALGRGVCGHLLFLRYIDNVGLVELDTDAVEVLEAKMEEAIDQAVQERNYDLQQGLIGYGVYYLEALRFGHGKAAEKVCSIVAELLSIFVKRGRWWLLDYLLETNPNVPQECPWSGLGLLHGMSSAAAFLLSCIEEGIIRKSETGDILSSYRDLCMELCRKEDLTFPLSCRVVDDHIIGDNRKMTMAYCLGGPGIINTLMRLSTAFHWVACGEMAERAAQNMIASLDSASMPASNCFCHGKAGLLYFILRWKKDGDSHADRIASALKRECEKVADDSDCTGLLRGHNSQLIPLHPHRSKIVEHLLLLS